MCAALCVTVAAVRGCCVQGNADAPLSGEGVLIELVQAPRDVIEAMQ
jgi:hypothetical protein